jgi:hypothetical protein
MQTINLEALDILSLEQIEACFIDVADTVMHCADNHLPIDYVIGMLRTALHTKIEATLLASLREMTGATATTQQAPKGAPAGFNPQTATPPWAQQEEPKKKTRKLSNNARI